MEAEMQMDELESIMSEDMDFFDEQLPGNQGQQAQLTGQSSTTQKRSLNTPEDLSSNKRQRVNVEDGGADTRPLVGLEKESGSHKNHSQQSEQYIVSIKTEPVDPSEIKTTNHESSKSKNLLPFEQDEPSFIEDIDLLKGVNSEDKEATKTPLRPVTIKLEVKESKIDEDLPKKLVLVEFRSLTVTVPPKTKPKPMLSNSYAKNFKRFRKNRVPGAETSPHIIGGSDLLVHNRGKNTDLDEWLKDAAEEERQSRRDETVGDDLFRYNPTKLTKRR